MAADLARARARANRTKRPYQPTLSAYFSLLYAHQGSLRPSISSTDEQDDPRYRNGETRLAPLEGSVQASLLNVGMRVRKAVSGGYRRQAGEFGGLKAGMGYAEEMDADKENAACGGVADAMMGRKKRPLYESEGEGEEDALDGGLSWSDVAGKRGEEDVAMELNGQERKIAQPASRLRQGRMQSTVELLPVRCDVDHEVDFEEADFLMPKKEAEACSGEVGVTYLGNSASLGFGR